MENLSDAVCALYGDEDTDGAASLLSQAERAVGKLVRFDDSLSELHSRISELSYIAQDLASELRDKMEELSYSGDELEQIESRLDTLHRLKRKYSGGVDEILAYLDRAKEELDEIEFSDVKLERLEKKKAKLEADAVAAGKELRETRIDAAKKLEARLGEELAALDMPRAQFVCSIEEKPLSEDGIDDVCFLMTANIGEALKPMSKVASGGELARIMLAIKNVLAEQDDISTLIFDEVDAGVSGRAAQRVAEKLRQVSKGKQVLCVTHLPQIAAAADNHLLIQKTERDGRTFTQVTTLDLEGRKLELARIIGGAEITETTLRSAEEMIGRRA